MYRAAPMATVLRMSDVGPFIEDLVKQVHLGVFNARKTGVLAELPDKIAVKAVVIADEGWGALEQLQTQTQSGQSNQGGGETSQEESSQTTDGRTDTTGNTAQSVLGSQAVIGTTRGEGSETSNQTVRQTATTTFNKSQNYSYAAA